MTHPDDLELLARLEWELLPIDFRQPLPLRVDWSAWAGYDPWNNPAERPAARTGKPRHHDRHRPS